MSNAALKDYNYKVGRASVWQLIVSLLPRGSGMWDCGIVELWDCSWRMHEGRRRGESPESLELQLQFLKLGSLAGPSAMNIPP